MKRRICWLCGKKKKLTDLVVAKSKGSQRFINVCRYSNSGYYSVNGVRHYSCSEKVFRIGLDQYGSPREDKI